MCVAHRNKRGEADDVYVSEHGRIHPVSWLAEVILYVARCMCNRHKNQGHSGALR